MVPRCWSLEGSENFLFSESHRKILNLLITEWIYPHVLNMNRGSLCTRSFRHIHFSVFRYRWIENSFTGLKSSQGFWEVCLRCPLSWSREQPAPVHKTSPVNDIFCNQPKGLMLSHSGPQTQLLTSGQQDGVKGVGGDWQTKEKKKTLCHVQTRYHIGVLCNCTEMRNHWQPHTGFSETIIIEIIKKEKKNT